MNTIPAFTDRAHAGRVLAPWLRDYADRPEVVVLALPRGGVPVAAEVARRLGAPLELLVVRKLGLPGHEEFAMGAIASGGIVVLHDAVLAAHAITPAQFETVRWREETELARRERAYRRGPPRAPLTDRIVILVDDGIATGATMSAAVQAVRAEHPLRIIVAVPVAARASVEQLRHEADAVIAVLQPAEFDAIGAFYADFRQIEEEQVRALLAATPAARRSLEFCATTSP